MDQEINFNGRTYHSADEMPPEVRRAYEKMMSVFADKNQNGEPDMFEGLVSAGMASINLGGVNIYHEGKVYHSLDDLPPDARQRYEQAMAELDANRNGIPDMVEGMFSAGSPPTTGATRVVSTVAPVSAPPPPADPQLEGTGIRWLLLAVAVFAAVLCIGAIAIAIWMRF